MQGSTFSEPEYLRGLKGSPEAKRRAAVVLEFLAGMFPFEEGCARLGISEDEFDKLVTDAAKAMLAGLQEFGHEESQSSS